MHKTFRSVARSLSGPQALIPGHGQAYGLGLTQHPTGQAVSAEAGEIHHLDVLHVRAAIPLDQGDGIRRLNKRWWQRTIILLADVGFGLAASVA
jgi:hypothetical protein